MKEANEERAWLHTSSILAMVHNTVAKRSRKPDDFNPLKQKNNPRVQRGLSLKGLIGAIYKKVPESIGGPRKESENECRSRKRPGR